MIKISKARVIVALSAATTTESIAAIFNSYLAKTSEPLKIASLSPRLTFDTDYRVGASDRMELTFNTVLPYDNQKLLQELADGIKGTHSSVSSVLVIDTDANFGQYSMYHAENSDAVEVAALAEAFIREVQENANESLDNLKLELGF